VRAIKADPVAAEGLFCFARDGKPSMDGNLKIVIMAQVKRMLFRHLDVSAEVQSFCSDNRPGVSAVDSSENVGLACVGFSKRLREIR
jgi:hypothetical protein